MATAATGGPVVVTGATGYIAAHLIQQLLEQGYTVHSTVRSLAKKDKYAYLLELPGASERLKLFEADLNDAASFKECIQGAEYVLHVASPYSLTVEDPQRDLVDPAVNGTVAVLEICADTPSVKKVVITSSMAAVTDDFGLDHPYTEADWNETSSLTRNPYYYSKVRAEKAAYEFMEQRKDSIHFKLCTINPSIVLGPHLGKGVNASVETIQRLLNGEFPGVPNLCWTITDVREAAQAHILAMNTPEAEGRFLCCHGPFHLRDVCAVLRERYPNYAVPTANLPDWVVRMATAFESAGTRDYLQCNLGKVPNVDNTKSKEVLGLKYRPMEETVLDTAADLVQNNHVHERRSSSCAIM